MLLADPARHWFGAPHKRFVILDDLQAMSVHMAMSGDLARNRAAAKLGFDLPIAMSQLCNHLVNAGMWEEAKHALRQLQRISVAGADVAALKAAVALHEGRHGEAKNLLERSLQIDANNAWGWLHLGEVYEAEGRVDHAKQSYERALGCLHTPQIEEAVAQARDRLSHPVVFQEGR